MKFEKSEEKMQDDLNKAANKIIVDVDDELPDDI